MLDSIVKAMGVGTYEVLDPDGTVVRSGKLKNAPTTVGLTQILSVHFAAGTQSVAWYAGLVNDSGFSAFAAADTMLTHGGWTELTTYSESVRQTWSPTVTSAVATNTTVMSFTIGGTVVVKGCFFVDNSTKSGTSGTLWATAAFDSSQSLVLNQVLRVTYTITATGS